VVGPAGFDVGAFAVDGAELPGDAGDDPPEV
jgi:hypothetical protein